MIVQRHAFIYFSTLFNVEKTIVKVLILYRLKQKLRFREFGFELEQGVVIPVPEKNKIIKLVF